MDKNVTVLCADKYVKAASEFTKIRVRYDKLNERLDAMLDEVSVNTNRIELYIRNVSGYKCDMRKQTLCISTDGNSAELFKCEDIEIALQDAFELRDDESVDIDEFTYDVADHIEEIHKFLPTPDFSFKTSNQQRETIGELVDKHAASASSAQALGDKLDEIESEHDELFNLLTKKIASDPNIGFDVSQHEAVVINVPNLKGPRIVICEQAVAEGIVSGTVNINDLDFDIYKGCKKES